MACRHSGKSSPWFSVTNPGRGSVRPHRSRRKTESFIDWPYGVVASVWTFVQRGPINDVVDEEVEVDIKHSLHHDAEMV